MPRMPEVDRGSGVSFEGRWIAPPSLPVCEPAQVLDGGENRSDKDRGLETRTEARPQWPFLYSYKGDTVIINTGPTKTKYDAAAEVGVATF